MALMRAVQPSERIIRKLILIIGVFGKKEDERVIRKSFSVDLGVSRRVAVIRIGKGRNNDIKLSSEFVDVDQGYISFFMENGNARVFYTNTGRFPANVKSTGGVKTLGEGQEVQIKNNCPIKIGLMNEIATVDVSFKIK